MTRVVDVSGRGVRVEGRGVGVGTAIPDSGDLQAYYDATDISATDGDSITTWPDSSGNSYDLTGGSPIYDNNALNGNPIVSFDGSGDDLKNDWGTINQPFTIFVVAKLNELPSTQGNSYFWSLASGNLVGLYSSSGDNNYRVYAGNGFTYSSTDTNWHILSTLVDGANSELRVDGVTVATGDAGNRDMSGFNLGSRGDRDEDYTNIDIAEAMHYPQDKSGIYSDVESYLNGKWAVY